MFQNSVQAKRGINRKVACLASLIGLLLVVECALRAFVQVPLYGADNLVGYFPLPNQHGTFLKNDWYFNELGMGVPQEYSPSARRDILLIGDSLVYGGNGLRQPEKLGPTLERLSGATVWSVGAGSWALQNEILFTLRIKAVRKNLDEIVFVVNSGDFGLPSFWSNNLTHPRYIHNIRLLYFFERYILGKELLKSEPIFVRDLEDHELWMQFIELAHANKIRVLVVGYEESLNSGGCNWIPRYISEASRVICFNKSTISKFGLRDNIHPNPEGNQVLANFINRNLTAQ